MHSEAATVYMAACNRDHAECALELVNAFNQDDRDVLLSQRAVPLNDVDIGCIAEALRAEHSLHVINFEENAFGLQGVQALMEALEDNPGVITELRLGKNKLKDQAAVVIGHTLSRNGCGLKVLDLSENGITKLGVIPLTQAVGTEVCDVVELSLHNNKIESDAATYLAQALRQTKRLKHLHLGYNSIRDTGAMHLARCIPISTTLSTLDLTANRIGAEGGQEIARALMTSTCSIQRLNLRHNQFDADTIELFGEVLLKNTSLIQLFLGFMNPTAEAAAVVLSSLRHNRTLLLLDIYGWKLELATTKEAVDDILMTNTSVAAIVTDACQPLNRDIDDGNFAREARNLHPIYIGPDDRDAYLATKSLRQFSRAQSRRQSRASSRRGETPREGSSHRSRSRHSASRRRRSRSSSVHVAEAELTDHKESPAHTQPSAPPVEATPPPSSPPPQQHNDSVQTTPAASHRDANSAEPATYVPQKTEVPLTYNKPGIVVAANSTSSSSILKQTVDQHELSHTHVVSTTDREIAELLVDLRSSASDSHVPERVSTLVDLLQYKIDTQRIKTKKDLQSLEDRITALEARRECTCNVPLTKYIEPRHMSTSRHHEGSSYSGEHANNSSSDLVAAKTNSTSYNASANASYAAAKNTAATTTKTTTTTTTSSAAKSGSTTAATKASASLSAVNTSGQTGSESTSQNASRVRHTDISSTSGVGGASNGSANNSSGVSTALRTQQSSTNATTTKAAELSVAELSAADRNSELEAARAAKRSDSAARATTPLHRPSEQRPNRAEPPSEPTDIKERKPADVNLQQSVASETNFRPRINPSPMRDSNPPRRKSFSQAKSPTA